MLHSNTRDPFRDVIYVMTTNKGRYFAVNTVTFVSNLFHQDGMLWRKTSTVGIRSQILVLHFEVVIACHEYLNWWTLEKWSLPLTLTPNGTMTCPEEGDRQMISSSLTYEAWTRVLPNMQLKPRVSENVEPCTREAVPPRDGPPWGTRWCTIGCATRT